MAPRKAAQADAAGSAAKSARTDKSPARRKASAKTSTKSEKGSTKSSTKASAKETAKSATKGKAKSKASDKTDDDATWTNPVTTHFDFGGPLGAGAIILILPFVIWAVNMSTGRYGLLTLVPFGIPTFPALADMGLISWRAIGIVFGWFAFQVVLHLILPGEIAEGVVLRDGKRLSYCLNGLLASAVSLTTVFSLWWFSLADVGIVADEIVALAGASNLLALIISVYVYLNSFTEAAEGGPRMLAVGGNSGNVIYDYYIGRELNPRVLGGLLDLKFFCELRPGMIGWMVINGAFLVRQYEAHGMVSNSMIMVNVFQAIYVLDALLNEKAILTTMDLTTEGLGFMLTFGVLAWVPFTYSLQANFLRWYPVELHPTLFVAIVGLMMLGYWIFRAANSTKDLFRANPDDPAVSHITFIQTQRGTRLMTSGWWGLSRHINYLGDWIIAWSWCLPTGFATPVTYKYVIYFGILLLHRERRDDANCRAKYGADWDTYCEQVRSRIIPGVY